MLQVSQVPACSRCWRPKSSEDATHRCRSTFGGTHADGDERGVRAFLPVLPEQTRSTVSAKALLLQVSPMREQRGRETRNAEQAAGVAWRRGNFSNGLSTPPPPVPRLFALFAGQGRGALRYVFIFAVKLRRR